MRKCFIALLAAIASLWGCDGPSGTELLGEIKLSSSSKDVIEIDSDGSTESVRFSSALDWDVECADTWLTISPMEGGPGPARISIKADQNDTQESRQAVVTLCSDGFELPITVTQEPFVATFDLLDVEKEVSCLGGEIVVSVYTDVDFSYECQDNWALLQRRHAPVRSHLLWNRTLFLRNARQSLRSLQETLQRNLPLPRERLEQKLMTGRRIRSCIVRLR